MPEELHRKLHAEALKHGYQPGTEKYNAFVYGTLQKIEAKKNAKHSGS